MLVASVIPTMGFGRASNLKSYDNHRAKANSAESVSFGNSNAHGARQIGKRAGAGALGLMFLASCADPTVPVVKPTDPDPDLNVAQKALLAKAKALDPIGAANLREVTALKTRGFNEAGKETYDVLLDDLSATPDNGLKGKMTVKNVAYNETTTANVALTVDEQGRLVTVDDINPRFITLEKIGDKKVLEQSLEVATNDLTDMSLTKATDTVGQVLVRDPADKETLGTGLVSFNDAARGIAEKIAKVRSDLVDLGAKKPVIAALVGDKRALRQMGNRAAKSFTRVV